MTRVKRSGHTGNPYTTVGGTREVPSVVTVAMGVVFVVGCIVYQLMAAYLPAGRGVQRATMAVPEESLGNNDGVRSYLKGLRRRTHGEETRNVMKIDFENIGNDDGDDEDPSPLLVNRPSKKLSLAQDIYKTREEKDEFDPETSMANHDAPHYAFDDHLMFHNYIKGKSGSVVEEMLMAHAYIFHHNATYGGCCGNPSLKMTAHETLLSSLGLRGVLQFKCPRDYDEEDVSVRRSVIPRDKFHSDDTRIWTPEYVDYLRSLITYPKKRYPDEYTIAVHMQRGDTTPCRPKHDGYHRYLPNSHYQALIDKYMKPGARVIVYTTSAKSFENLEEFRKRGYEVHADASMADSWKDFATADVMIMSRSDFLMVPAMVAQGTVVYTPFWHHSLRRWKRVSKAIMQETDEETERLRIDKCGQGAGASKV